MVLVMEVGVVLLMEVGVVLVVEVGVDYNSDYNEKWSIVHLFII